ncbi:hypothetical protein [Oceanithermus profundus]|uniref:hypothetical protein n=1 Tax=Oceanithermus profundus TaxID=187137 RepID=UPI0011D207AB|nr:hypothetical protein [Oceanithermus profundus]
MQSTKSSRTGELLPSATRKTIEAAFQEAASILASGNLSPLYGIARASAYHQRFSPRNRLLLWGQAPHARMVRGAQGWRALRREVLPGAPAYLVIAPQQGGYGLLKVYDVSFTRGRSVRLTPASVQLASLFSANREAAAGEAAGLIKGTGLEAELARVALLYALGLFPWYQASLRAGERLEERQLFRVAENALKRADRALKVLENKARTAREAERRAA